MFDVIRQAPPLMIVTRAYSHGIYGIDMARMDRRLRPGVLKDYKAAMAEKSELKRNGRLFEIERKLANFKASKHSVVSYKARSIKSRIAEVTVEELEDLVRKAL